MKPVHVTEPFLPPKEDYEVLLSEVWERNWLTNQGPLVKRLEEKLQIYHGISTPVYCLANGGLGLQIALKALDVKGEVITTPFSYIATASAPLWEGCSLRFADVDPVHLTIDPDAIETALTPQTEAIVATHVFGNPCDVHALQTIADKNGLALIYDAAHAFGVRYDNKSILEYGDVSMVSTHATKLFHTVEGGFVVAKDEQVGHKMEWMRRFGHDGPDAFHGVGINAKMSEFHAAMGLANLNVINSITNTRKRAVEHYNQLLSDNSICKPALHIREGCEWNYSYYPVIFNTEKSLLNAMERMQDKGIYVRRYFYPSLDDLPFLANKSSCEKSHSIAARIVCLPLFHEISEEIIEGVVSSIG